MALPKYFRRVQRLLFRKGHSWAEAEDLIQEAFLRMQEYCNEGGEVRQPEAFLIRTAVRLGINAQRDAHHDLYVDKHVEELTQLIDASPCPDEVLAAEECLVRMRNSLDAVSPRTREVFFMQRIDGLTYVEIARNLGISVSAIEKHMARALAVLSDDAIEK